MNTKDESKKFRTLKMTFEDDFQKTVNEIVLKEEHPDGISFNDLMNTFRQFVLALGYSEDSVKLIRNLRENDLAFFGLTMDELNLIESEEW